MKLKQLISLPIVAVAIFSLVACKKSDNGSLATAATDSTTSTSTYTAQNVPSKSKVATPDTLNSTTSSRVASVSGNQAGNLSHVQRVANTASKNASGMGENDAMGLMFAKIVVQKMKRVIQNVDLNMMFVDASITDGSLTQGSSAAVGCLEAGVVKFKITEGMVKKMTEGMQEFGMTEAEATAELVELQGMIGTEISGPPIHYFANALNGVAGKAVKIGQMSEDGTSTSSCASGTVDTPSETIKWSDDKNFLDYKAKMDFGTEKMSVVATYDGVNAISAFEEKYASTTFGSGTFKAKFRECEGTTTNCVDFNVFLDQNDSSGQFKMKIEGRTDNEGGFSTGKMSMTMAGVTSEFYMKEYWDGNGTLSALAFSDDGSTWHSVAGMEPAADNAYESGAQDTTPGGATLTFAYSTTLTTDADYLVFEGGETELKPEEAIGFIAVNGGAIIIQDFFIPPSNGAQGDIYEITGFNTATGEQTISTTKASTVTVTF